MAYTTRYYNRGLSYSGSGGWFPPGVKWLLIANIGIFVLTFFAGLSGNFPIVQWFGLRPRDVVPGLQVWRLVTYLFLHGGITHILFNMLALWMFGKDIENSWGTRRFLKFYFSCGIVAGLCAIVLNYLFGNPYTYTIGASGAIYGVLVAFGMMYPTATVLLIIFPIQARYFVMIVAAITFLGSFEANSGVSNFAHLGGLAFGFLYMKSGMAARRYYKSSKPGLIATWRARYKRWQVDRAKRKFEVYMRKQGQRPPWVN